MLVFYFIYINKKYLETTLYKFWLTYNVISKKKNKTKQNLTGLGAMQTIIFN